MTTPKYEGSPKVNPENHRVNGRSIKGWIVERLSPGASTALRVWLELFKPDKVPEGCRARPLVYGDETLAQAPAEAPAPRPPVAVVVPKPAAPPGVPPRLQELRDTCKRNKKMGHPAVTCDYVLACIGDE